MAAGNRFEPRCVELVMGDILYCFGDGDRSSSWASPADVDLGALAGPDAVALDFDGDGSVDDAMWDTDGDRVADTVALDLDDDGSVDAFYADPSGRGVWDTAVDTPAATPTVDYSGDGVADDVMVDTDSDATPDAVLIGAEPGAGRRFGAMVVYGEPDSVLIDSDGDGILDGVRGGSGGSPLIEPFVCC